LIQKGVLKSENIYCRSLKDGKKYVRPKAIKAHQIVLDLMKVCPGYFPYKVSTDLQIFVDKI
jgi:hypothetical protein